MNKAPKKSKTKFVFIVIDERNGEYEYHHKLVREIPARADVSKWAEKNLVSNWYGKKGYEERGGYFFNGGEVFVRLSHTKVLNQQEYDILSSHL